MRIAAFPAHLKSNPYCDLLYGNLAELGAEIIDGGELSLNALLTKQEKADVFHFHWLERYCQHWRGGLFSYFTLLKFMIYIKAAKLLGYDVVWTMHNLVSHESANPKVDKKAAAFMARNARTVVHCEHARKLILKMVSDAYVTVIPHGHYKDCYPVLMGREEARKNLGIPDDKKLLLFFGMIRLYKGIKSLCETFSSLNRKDSILLIVGKPYEEREERMIEDLMQHFKSHNIRFIPGYVPNEEVSKYFAACDYTIFPYRNVLTSGSVILSLSFGRPIIVPRIGCLSELEDNDLGFFYDASSLEELKVAIKQAINSARWQELSRNAEKYADKLNWDNISDSYMKLFGGNDKTKQV